jgi:serpin B
MNPILASALVSIFATTSLAQAAKPASQDEKLTFALMKRMNTNRNQVFSPYSVSSAFSLLALGARGETRNEMNRVFGFESDDKILVEKLMSQQKSFTDMQGFSSASEVWFSTQLALKSDYKNTLKDQLQTPLMEADFATPTGREQTARDINSFASSATNGKIGQIVSSDGVTSDLSMILVNAVAFTGKWKNEFKPTLTKTEVFKTAAKSVKVPFMHQQGDIAYAAVEKSFQMIALPYDDDRLSMVLILPDAKVSLPALAESMKLSSALADLHARPVNIALPKFKFTADLPELATDLSALGLKSAFTKAADFSGMSEHKSGIAVSKVIHKALIEVDEKGTEAAAATAVKMEGYAFKKRLEFKLDRPFMFMIVDSKTERILFAGWIAKP